MAASGLWSQGPVEDLWYHALRFLDRYRTGVESHNITEFYQFSDQTGILERHRQMLAQPFKENQVDMKIMYYELIRMLIDYERKNHPKTYDATKTVGKIEGYQELTNKLQRYLNQRFIEDMDDLLKGQEGIKSMFGGNTININQRFEKLEESYSSVEMANTSLQSSLTSLEQKFCSFTENHDTLQQKFTVLQSTNSSLVERLRLQESNHEQLRQELSLTTVELQKEMAEKDKLQRSLNEQQIVKEQEVNGQISSINLAASALQSRLENQEQTTDAHHARITTLESSIADIESQKLTNKVDELEKNEAEIQLKMQNLESADLFLQEANRMLIEKSSGIELEIKQIDINFDQLRMSTENKIQTNMQSIAKNTSTCQSNATSINSILMTQSSISEQLDQLNSKHAESWTSVDSFLAIQSDMVKELNLLVETDTQKIETFGSGLQTMEQNFSKMESKLESIDGNMIRSNGSITEIVTKVTSQGNRLEEFESEAFSGRERVNKINESIDTINRTIQTFEGQHMQTDEKIQKLRAQEQKMMDQGNSDINQIKKQLQDIEVNADDKIMQLNKDLMEKVVQLEDGHMNQVQKVAVVERLGERVNQIEAERQRSESVAKDEVDASMNRSRQHMEKLEKQIHETVLIQKEKVPLMESMKAKITKIEKDQTQLDQQRQEELKATVAGNALEIQKVRSQLETQLGDLKQSSRQDGEVIQNALMSVQQNLKTEEERVDVYFVSIEERFRAAEKDLHANALAYQETLDRKLSQLVENQQKQNEQGETMQRQVAKLDDKTNDKIIQLREVFTSESVQRFESLRSEMTSSVEKLHKEVQITTKLMSDNSGNQDEAFERFCDETNRQLDEKLARAAMTLSTQLDQLGNSTGDKTTDIETKLIGISETIKNNKEEIDKVNQELTTLGLLTQENLTNFQNSLDTRDASHSASFTKISESMSRIMEQGNSTLLKNAQQESKIIALENNNLHIEDKMSNLEDADRFLQESYTQVTNRTIKLENGLKEAEAKLVNMLKEQEDILEKVEEEIKVIKQENCNSSDMIENLTNKATDTMTSQMKSLKVDTEQQMLCLQESINIQSEEVKKVEGERQKSDDKIQDDIEATVASNAKAISDLKNEVAQSVSERMRPAEERLSSIDGAVEGINKTVAVFEDRHTENMEKMKEVAVLTSSIQVQIKAQEQKIVEQSTNDMNRILEQLEDVENQAGLNGLKIKELDTGNQTLLEKVLGMENQVAGNLDDLAKADASLLSKINGIESTNDQALLGLTSDLEKKLTDSEHKLNQASKTELQSLGQHLEDQMRSNHSTTERRLAEADAGSQQLLEKLLDVEKDVEGRLMDKVMSVQSQLGNLETDTRSNTQQIVSIHESINMQVEDSKRVDAERQKDSAKVKEDLAASVAFNTKSIAELQNSVGVSIDERLKPAEDKLKQVDGDIQIIHKSVAIFESRHVETIEKLKEVTVVTNNIQTQVNNQAQQMVEQSAYQINDRLQDLEVQVGHTGQRIQELDTGHQNLLEKVTGIDTDLNGKLHEQEEIVGQSANSLNKIKGQITRMETESEMQLRKISDIEKSDISSNSEITSLLDTRNHYLQHIQEFEILSDKVDNLDANQTRSEAKLKTELIDSIAQKTELIRTFCQTSLQTTEESITQKVVKVEEEISDINAKVVSLQDSAMVQEQKAQNMDSLASRVSQMDEMRQQSEAKTKKESEEQETRNATEIKELRRSLEFSLGELEKQINDESRSLRTDSIDLRKKGDALRDKLAKYEDVIDKRINNDIMLRIDHLDDQVAEFGKNVDSLKSDTSTKLSGHEERIVTLISCKEEHSSLLESHSSSMATVETRLVALDQKTKAIAENLLITSKGQLTEMKNQFDGRIAELIMITNDQGGVLDRHDESLTGMVDHSRRIDEDLTTTQREVEELQRRVQEEKGLVVMKFKETKDSLESFFEKLDTVKLTQTLESSRVEVIERNLETQERLASQLEERLDKVERTGEEQGSLIMAVEKTAQEKVDEIETELQTYVNNSQQDLRKIRGSTVTIKSEGAMGSHLPDVLGVYRMVDSHGNRPVYKQDGGENYIYYSNTLSAWFVGTVVGHEYGWMRNQSKEAADQTWVPDLQTAWEYRPLVRMGDSLGTDTWLQDDDTLRVESLKDVDKVGEAFSAIPTLSGAAL